MTKVARSREPRSRSSKLTLALDANSIIARRYRLDGPRFAVIERAVSLRKLQLAIPRIVVEEVQNKFREEISRASHRISSEIAKLNPLLPQGLQRTFAPLEIDKITADFVRRFSNRLDELQASRPGYAKIPSSAIVARDLARRRPFQESGRGYRDTLLWETIVRNVASNAWTTVFVTENKKDFCADDTNTVLHPDLVADLKSRGFGQEAIEVCPTIESFVDRYAGQLLPTSAEVLTEIQSGRYKMFSFSAFFKEHTEEIQEQLSREVDRSGTLGVDYIEGENPEVVYVEDPSSAEIREAYELDSQKLFLSYDVTADANVHFFVFKADYYAMPDEVDFQIEQFDWNDHYISASKVMTLPLRFSLELKVGSPDIVESFEVEIVEFYGWCWKCGDPIRSDAAETCARCKADLLKPVRRRRKMLED